MLMTPIRPNTIAKPNAISTSTVNRLRPLKACMMTMSGVMGAIVPPASTQPGAGRRTADAVRRRAMPSDLRERVRLDQRRFVDHVDLPVGPEGADPDVLPQVVVLLVELHLPLRRVD